jgi:hypothetical protein
MITINKTPATYTFSGNPMTIVLESDNSSVVGMKYVCNVSIDGTLVTRLKASPNPDTELGFFDVQSIVAKFVGVDADVNSSWTMGQNCTNMFVDVNVEFAEEISGAITTFSQFDFRAITYAMDWLDFPSVTLPDFFQDGTTQHTRALTENQTYKFTTDARSYLYFPITMQTGSNLDLMHVEYYDAMGNLIRQYEYNSPVRALHDASDENPSPLMAVPFGPKALEILPDTICSDTQPGSFGLNEATRVVVYGVLNSMDLDRLTEIYEYQIIEPCPAVETTTMHFLWGGVETYVFTKPKREFVESEKTNSSKPAISTTTGLYSQSDYGRFVANVKSKQRFSVVSDWLTDNEFEWLSRLVQTPRAWVDDGIGNMVPIIITNTSFQKFKRQFDQLQQLTIEFEYTFDQTNPFQ